MNHSISEQFWGPMEIADWITKEYNKDNIKKLLNKDGKVPHDHVRELDFWVIGPKESETGLFIYGHLIDSSGSTEGKIRSIIPVSSVSIYVKTTTGKIFFLLYSRSLHHIVKKVDMFLNGSYTDIALLHMDELFHTIEDIMEDIQ